MCFNFTLSLSLFLFCSVEQLSPKIVFGGGNDFVSQIGLFKRLPGTELWSEEVESGSSIELGENVQLRSIVRPGDGELPTKLFPISEPQNPRIDISKLH